MVEVDNHFFDQVVKRSESVESETPVNKLSENIDSQDSAECSHRKLGRIWNLTPHPMHYDDGQVSRTIESDGSIRLEQENDPAEPIDGLNTVRARYGQPSGLPVGIAAGDVLIVSTLVGDCWHANKRPEGVTVIVPDTGETCKRDSNGRIVSVSRFIRK